MKKALTIFLLAASAIGANAQGYVDAFRYSQFFPVGTARTMAMGNAFTALGGDLGALGINPASSAVYNSCEFVVTPSLTFNNTSCEPAFYYGNADQKCMGMKLSIPNISAVFTLPTGRTENLVSWSFGFGANKVNNFNSHISYSGQDGTSSLLGNIACGLSGVPRATVNATDAYDSGSLPWQSLLAWDTYLVDSYSEEASSYIGATENVYEDGSIGVGGDLLKSFDRTTSGAMYEIQMNVGMNFSDQLYLGANMNVYTIDYLEESAYTEMADNPAYYSSGFEAMEYDYWQNTTGSGINLQVGVIWTPIPAVRLGAAYTTATLMTLCDDWSENMTSSFNQNEYGYKSSSKTVYPEYPYAYQVKAPARYSLGAAFVLGTYGLISMDYEHIDYAKTRIRNEEGYESSFATANSMLKSLNSCDIIRIGAEYNLNSDIALRAGYNLYMFGEPEYQFLSFGFGKRLSETAGIDVAYRTNLGNSYTHKPYEDYDVISARGAEVLEHNREILLTYKIKF